MRLRHLVLLLASLLASSAIAAPGFRRSPQPGHAQAGFFEVVVADSIDSPVSMSIAPDGRIFVCAQGGALRVIKDGRLLPRPFVVAPVYAFDEQGLLGVAFHPQFASNGHLYLCYTTLTPARHNRIVRYTASGDTALAGSAVTIFDLANNVANYHLGGTLRFGPDGMLYTGTGDNANPGNSQSLSTTFGKLLRIDPDGSVPTDNPFYGSTTGINRAIWARGLRNAFSFSFQPGTGRLFINDVGQDAFEEVNDGIAGGNYGWPSVEGPGGAPTYLPPIHSYNHSQGCAITGGTFYDPPTPTFPAAWVGRYFYADYCAGEIRWIDPASPALFSVFRPSLAPGPLDLHVGPDGDLYYLVRGDVVLGGGGGTALGSVVRVSYAAGDVPAIVQHPQGTTIGLTQAATFTVGASGQTPFMYQWERDQTPIPGATGASYTTPAAVLADSGSRYRCRVTNVLGTAVSTEATLTVLNDLPPSPSITDPLAGAHYGGGTSLTFAGTADDPETGPLPASALTWWIDFHHGTHTHPAMPTTAGVAGGSYAISAINHTAADVWYRVWLQVEDPAGLVVRTYRDVLPDTARITLKTDPPGLALTLDGSPVTTPLTFTSVVGIHRTIGAPSPQSIGSQPWRFERWSDGGEREHALATPEQDITAIATFEPVPPDSTPIVDWGGDYVAADAEVRRFDSAPESGVILVGGQTGARWLAPHSDTKLFNPPASDSVGTSSRFYGGVRLDSYPSLLDPRQAGIREFGGADQLHSSGPAGTHGWDFRYWKKADFLSGAAEQLVQFGPGSRLEVIDYQGAGGVPENNSGRVHFAVRDAGQWWLSEDFGAPSGSVNASFVLSDPESRGWTAWDPDSGAMAFGAADSEFGPRAFRNIDAVGYLHTNQHLPAPVVSERAGFACSRVRVRAIVSSALGVGQPAVPAGPHRLSLSPNPARDLVRFTLRMPVSGEAMLEVFNLAGQRVATVASGARAAGEHALSWDARGVRPGVFFARLRSGAHAETRRVLIVN